MISTLLVIHVSCVVVSMTLFLWRGTAMWRQKPIESKLFKRTIPDIVDSILLFSAFGMMYLLEYSPFEHYWLAAKMIGLVVYILLGAVALKYGRSIVVKRVSFVAALIVFAYLVSVAATRQVLPV